MSIPHLKSPRFMLANRSAQAVLRELGNPEPPISLNRFIESRKWEIIHCELGGPDGMMVKMAYKGRVKYNIYIATDMKDETPYDIETIRRRQLFTLAHELGHILLHGSFMSDSSDFSYISPETAGILEVEAHWFASRLLMPNYVFRNINDLIPDLLAQKCKVNMTPAIKRLKNLTQNIKTSILQTVRLDKWPSNEPFELPDPDYPNAIEYSTWGSLEEAAAASELLYICPNCGLLHNERVIWGPHCTECNEVLVDIKSTLNNFLGVSKQVSFWKPGVVE